MRVGFIGAGRVVSRIAKAISNDGHDIAFVLSRKPVEGATIFGARHIVTLSDTGFLNETDLVIEAASPNAVKEFAPDILEKCDFAILSTTAFGDAEFAGKVEAIQQRTGNRLTLLSGGIVGLDGLASVGKQLVSVEIETVKSPVMWGLENHSDIRVLYEGPTREASKLYEKNVNVHASIAYLSIGFDRCKSRLISDPDAKAAYQKVRVVGEDFGWTIELHSTPIGGVTASLTPRAVLGSVRNLLNRG
ncbi:aspartate dehydrogenase domain-containing protein [Phyllobacterium endophyticum]|uniref:Aspartate dehydrogenase n=1 Tax=Phyllobacterium endophyticum TaxID=1149773 RepID=A0A2P7AKD5_9HYPH|nr:aspartate dehydrogenase domain-containing protein [Phyllobacterium endophyticum]MBB3237074.1 aspartate dehydrogenase [Phyllobacterium endophyticum]PSH54688.1 hypothetical protein CU100_26305 [Phyllobacterium endophyticum]TYR40545.1 DUF108 domain-containing protein [Phyllobacterium endophyticum]